MSPDLSIAVISEVFAELAICGPLDIPRCMPVTLPTRTGVENVDPWSTEVAQKILSLLPSTTRIVPRGSTLICGCAPAAIMPLSGAFQENDNEIEIKQNRIKTSFFILVVEVMSLKVL
jgi:hypothetical protein